MKLCDVLTTYKRSGPLPKNCTSQKVSFLFTKRAGEGLLLS